MAKRSQQFQTIRTEGAILPPDILRRIASLKVEGATPDAYHLPPGSKPNEAIAQSWAVLKGHWRAFQEARAILPESEQTATAVTNERWLLPLFKELDYGRLVTGKSPEIDERVYPIERFYNHTPIHLIGCKLPLDSRTRGARGAATASPHSMVQEFLNRSDEHVWAFLSNGLQLRVLRDNVSLSRQSFVEFDLESMMEGEVYADFALLWLLCHQSRVESDKAVDCWLEKWSKLARDQGTRVLKDLRVGVKKSIEALGRGFIGHPRNDQLREKLRTATLSTDEFYRQLLRMVYRLLFLFVAEDRELLHPPDSSTEACNLYDTHYSTRRLRELAHKIRGSKHADLWHSLSLVFDALSRNEGCPELGLGGLGSFLWRSSSTANLLGPGQTHSPSPLAGEGRGEGEDDADPVLITNDDLLLAIRELAWVEQDKSQRQVDYRNLGSEELGSVYESLLELHPVMNAEAKAFELTTAAGNERKTTGSYYTPDSLVQCLLDSALDPVVEDRLKGKKGEEAEQAILDMKVCDPACGSGHFLIAAAHRLARHLARVRTGESEPSPEDYQHALRDVIGRCVYGVDINPMAVELCKVSLWMEAIEPGKPLSFLDHHIQCGNSLLGTTPALLARGIPDDAFKPIEGDIKAICSELKRDNKKQRQDYESGQGYLFSPLIKLGNLPATIAQINVASDGSVEDVTAKQEMYERMVKGADYLNAQLLSDTWCAAFVWKKNQSDLGKTCPTERDFRNIEDNPHSILPHVKVEVIRLAKQFLFFHWHLAFPDVFRLPQKDQQATSEQTGWDGGFDVVLGNPPWEKVQFEERQFLESVGVEFETSSAADRRELLDRDEESGGTLKELLANARLEFLRTSGFMSASNLLPLSAKGKFNSYALFVELEILLVRQTGRVGLIVKTGIATDLATKDLFNELVENYRLVLLADFENSERIFADVATAEKFCLLTFGGAHTATRAKFGFSLTRTSQFSEEGRFYELSPNDILTLNPNSKTCAVFRNSKDATLALMVYQHFPVLWRKNPEDNPFGITFKQYFNASDDAELFRTDDVLEQDGFQLNQLGAFTSDGHTFLQLLEPKYFHHYDHRFGTYKNVPPSVKYGRKAPTNRLSMDEKNDPNECQYPRYWVSQRDFNERREQAWDRGYFFAFRDISNTTTNSRTAISAIVPHYPLTKSAPTILFDESCAATTVAFFAGMFASFPFDYFCRQKVGGSHLNLFIVEQFPVIPPSVCLNPCMWDAESSVGSWMACRVIELTYMAWDLEAFAQDCGYDGPPFRWDEGRRFLLRCELDAAYFHLFLGSPSEWGTDSPQLREMFPTPRDAVEYIMETFPIVKRKDIARTEVKNDSGEVTQEGRYITKDTILEIYDEMAEAIRTGQPYQTRLNPPPGPPADTKGNFVPMAQWDSNNWPPHIHPPRKESEVAT